MALSSNLEVDRFVDQELRSFAVAASVQVFKGALLEITDAGYVQPLTGVGRFAGLAYEEADNSNGAAGAVSVRVFTVGDFSMALAGATVASVGRPVYATGDDTLTLSPDGATFVGYAVGIESAGQIVLRLGSGVPLGATKLESHSTSFGVSAGQSGTTFVNGGAGGAITATLPGSPVAGLSYQFVCVADQEFRIAPGVGGGIYIKGAKQADNKYVSITDIGDFIHLVADGAGDWVAVASISGADGDITVET